MVALRTLPLLFLVSVFLRGQGEDIYQRVRLRLGEAAVEELRAKNFSRLEQLFAEAKPADDNERAEVLALSGAVAFLNGKMNAAVVSFHESEKIRPPKEEDRFTLAMALVRLGDETEARGILSSLAADHPNSSIYWYWLGRLDYDQRRYGEAVGKLEKAVKLDPNAARAWDSLGLAWDMQGKVEQAREKFEKAVSLNRMQAQPSPWPPHNFGYLMLRMGEAGQAETALRESLRYDGKLARTHYYLARALEKEDRADEAVKEYQLAVNGDLTSADSCYSLAMLYRKLHRESEANLMFAEFKRRKRAEPSTDH